MNKPNDVIGLGNTLMDFMIDVNDDILTDFGLQKGEMHLVDEIKAKELLTKIHLYNLHVETVPGGSSANTVKGVAFLGGKTIMCGKVGYDEHGQHYINEMQKFGMTSRIGKYPLTTAHSLTLITPDTERTFSVHLGAAVELSKDDIREDDIQQSKILHIEAYQLEGKTKETVLHAIELAKKHNTLVSIDLADPALIRRNKEFFTELVKNSIDIIFLNEKEAKEFTGLEEEEALNHVSQYVKIAVVKLGKEGSLIHDGKTITKINSVKANAIDTTGAGDTFAAGFLYGYCNGWDTKRSGDLGSLFAARVVEQKGVGLKGLDKEKIKNPHKNIKIGIIGGSGLYNPAIVLDSYDITVETPYGKPSSPLKVGKIQDVDVVLLSRHGRDHSIPPTQVNYRANIHALKKQGCTHIIATTACGSLRKDIGRGDFVILDQFIDFTKHRKITFHEEFPNGKIVHTPMAEPFAHSSRNILIDTCTKLGLKHHTQGTVITIEGPRFSTKAESKMFRAWGADVINMSIAPEVTLANEAGIPYAAVAMSTDYDCLFDDVPSVLWEDVLKVFDENVSNVISLLTTAIPNIGKESYEKKFEHKNAEFDLKSTIRTVPHWPKQGVMFRDITTLLQNPNAFKYVIQKFKERYQNTNITKIAGIDSRGFIFGSVLARELHLPFVLIRKKGKLPPKVISQEYQLEYGIDTVEINEDAINQDDIVLIIDDLIALGGTAHAACTLIEKCGGHVHELAVVIELSDLKGREKLYNYPLFSLVTFEGD